MKNYKYFLVNLSKSSLPNKLLYSLKVDIKCFFESTEFSFFKVLRISEIDFKYVHLIIPGKIINLNPISPNFFTVNAGSALDSSTVVAYLPGTLRLIFSKSSADPSISIKVRSAPTSLKRVALFIASSIPCSAAASVRAIIKLL